MNREGLENLGFSSRDIRDAVFNELHGINEVKQIKYEMMFKNASCKDDRKKWGGKLLTLKTVRECIKDHVNFIRMAYLEPIERRMKNENKMEK